MTSEKLSRYLYLKRLMKKLKELFEIQELLKSIKYPDYIRIATEVLEFLNNNSNISKDEVFKRLKEEQPWEYIQGYCEFCNSQFTVNRDVLIPRVETEQLVNDVIECIRNLDYPITLIDVGTGTGCIPISILKEIPNIKEVIATDISSKALEVAKRNEEKILGKKRIQWINTDLLNLSFPPSYPSVITANLPYIPTKQYLKLQKSVKDYEPRVALDGGNNVPDLYEKMYKQITFPVAQLFIETEESVINEQLKRTEDFFDGYTVQKKSDLYGRDRFIYITK